MILVSSEHVFPYRLRHPDQDFNLRNFNGFIYAGEVPPKDMYELLTMKWGIEPNVALALIDIYGGHIYDMEDAISRLHSENEEFDNFFDSDFFSDVQRCLNWKFENEEDNVRMRDTLRQLSITGFVSLKEIDDPVAKVISLNNVGGVVKKSGVVVGLD